MAKFKLIHKLNGKPRSTVGEYATIEEAVRAGGKYRLNDYCLDKEEYRTEGLRLRGYCILGCGNEELEIQEI